MIAHLRNILRSPRQRTQLESVAGGALILSGLAARYLFGAARMHDGFMIVAALIAGTDIAMRAWNSLRNRHVSIELLVTIAAIGALIIGEFWEAAAVTFLFVFGAYLEARTLSRTRKVLGELLDLAPVTALVIRDGQQVEVEPSQVALGEIVLIKPGVRVPVDGEVVGGASAVDESSITGEPIPEEKFSGSLVFAGTINLDGMLQARATGVGADTTLARIIARVEEAQEEKAPTQRFIERFARWYTPAIILLSAGVYIITRDIELALTLLVIACPGALVISTPVSIIAGIGQAARRGILIKGGEYLENAARISALALDKTGTLTYGKPRLTDILALQPLRAGLLEETALSGTFNSTRWTVDQTEVLYWAGIAESVSEHPLARAIYNEARALTTLPTPDTFETVTGRGIRARFMGHEISVGTEKWLKEQAVAMEPGIANTLLTLREEGKTATLVSLDGVLIGVLGISDPIRETSAEAIKRLYKGGIREVVMLTGDDEKTAWAIAHQAGIRDVKAGLLPEDKLRVVRDLQTKGYTIAMVGDGINDTPALAAADIGIAMGAAAAGLAIETADIALISDDLLKVPEAIHLSKATLRNIRQNVVIALLTVGALLSGVLLGKVHMAGGMLVHQLSVLLVIFNGMRLLRNGSKA
ncbi:MAG: cation-translocating P-type ATPase [Anaerolineaceae bacterium]|nr:cation-translocating P-type ATPase [Anaerolineaceae bacterium]